MCSGTADSASCHNFLFSEHKIANGYSDDNAKGHKSPIFQELKLCSQKEQGRTTEESSISIQNVREYPDPKNLFGEGSNWLVRVVALKFGPASGTFGGISQCQEDYATPGPCLDCRRG